MNILTLHDGVVEFTGFDGLEDDSVITVRVLADKLVINLGDIQTETGKMQVQLKNRKSSDPDLCDLFRYCCGKSPTTFISLKSRPIEFFQT